MCRDQVNLAEQRRYAMDLQGEWEAEMLPEALVLRPRGTTGEARSHALQSTLACRLGRYGARLAPAFSFLLALAS